MHYKEKWPSFCKEKNWPPLSYFLTNFQFEFRKNLSKISGVKFTWRLLFRKALRPVFIIVATVCKISTRSFGYFWVLGRRKYYQSYSEKKFTDISVAKSVLIQSFTLKTLTNVLPKVCFLINSQKQVEKCLHKKLSKEQPPWTLFILG